MRHKPSSHHSGGQPWGLWPTLGLSALAIAIMFSVGISLSSIFVIGVTLRQPDVDPATLEAMLNRNGWLLAANTILTGLISTGVLILFARLRRSLPVKVYLSLHRASWREFLSWNTLMVGFIFLSEWLTRWLNQSSDFLSQALANPQALPFVYFAVVVAAPITEELLFRGFMFRGLQDSRLGVAGAILIGSLVWAVIHLQYNLYFMSLIFCMGVLLGLARWQTRSIYIPISMHALNNLLAAIST